MANVSLSVAPPFPEVFRERFYDLLDPVGKAAVNSRAVGYLGDFVRGYILSIAPRNHKTALSFTPAATPTGHLEDAARHTYAKGNANGGVVSITSPGITRAFHALNIKAKSKMLTIPARPSPEAYGKRAREVALMEPLFLVKTKAAGAFLATGTEPMGPQRPKGRRPPPPKRVRPHKPNRAVLEAKEEHGIRPVFWLRSAVTIPQKRDILPSDAAITREARQGYLNAWRRMRARTGT